MFRDLFVKLKSESGVDLITTYGIPEDKLDDVLDFAKWILKNVFSKELKASGTIVMLEFFRSEGKVNQSVFFKEGVDNLSSKLEDAGLDHTRSLGASELIIGSALEKVRETGRDMDVENMDEIKELMDVESEGFMDRMENFISDTLGNVSDKLGGVGGRLGHLFKDRYDNT